MRDWSFFDGNRNGLSGDRVGISKRKRHGLLHRRMGLLLVPALLLSAVCREFPMVSPFGSSVQAATEAPAADETTADGTAADGTAADGEEAEIEEEVDETAGLLEEENGRISFWEWNKVTFDNWEDYFLEPDNFEYKEYEGRKTLISKHLEKNQYKPCMFVRYSQRDGEPHGFISTYADEKHIYRGSAQDFPSEAGTVPDKVSVYMKDYLENFDETKSIFLLQDEDGNSIDSKYFKQDRFYTTGGTLGVLFCKCLRTHRVSAEVNGKSVMVEIPQFDIALSRPSMKNNPDDESYRDYGLGKFKDYFLYVGVTKSGSNYGKTYLYLNDDEKPLNDEHDNVVYFNHWHLY
ncbi:MAG: hypothetical protein IJ733_01775, partial [Lachnospiraceae bacterium]|nr:hypothetical protein [Lachnospiraceae bacterium]